MKKVFIMLVLGAVLMANTAFAGGTNNVNEKVKAAFQKEFVHAKEVSWQQTDSYYKAVFKMNNDVLTAYFTGEGELMGVVRNLLSTELPINLQIALKNNYADYWVTDLFEFAKKNESGYFISLENAGQKITLQSGDGSNWNTYSKVKK
jgi:hypothetical protein